MHYGALDVVTKWSLAHPHKDRFFLTHGMSLFERFASENAIYA